jgi:hypothetical protein
VGVDGDSLLASVLVSLVGGGLFVYGKKQARFPQLVAGIVLAVYTYFISSVPLMLVIAAAVIGLMIAAIKLGW